MPWELISLPIIAALIGWGTNVLAIKMLFWPRRPRRILGWDFWGVLPKRQAEIASSIGQVLNDDLLPGEDLVQAVNTPEARAKVTGLICENLENKIGRFIPFFIPENARDRLRNHLHSLVGAEIETLFDQLGEAVSEELKTNKTLGTLVEKKINSFDLFQLEDLVLKVAKKELRHIELVGAILGFVIGLIQIALLLLFQKPPA